MARHIKNHFVNETTRKKDEVEDLLLIIQTSRSIIKKGMNGSVRSNVIYDKFDDIEQLLKDLIQECESNNLEYKDAMDF